MGLVLSVCQPRAEAGSPQEVLPDAGSAGLSHVRVWSFQLYLVLHHYSGGPGAHSTEQGTDEVLNTEKQSLVFKHQLSFVLTGYSFFNRYNSERLQP